MTALVPPTPPDLMTLGKVFATSGYFADARDQAQAVVKILAGQELGIGPVAAMTGIYIVKGRVTISSNLIGAQIKRSGKYDYRIRKPFTHEVCTLDFYERNGTGAFEPVGESVFTLADAQTAGLGGGENYRKFARNMLFARAISNGAKWYCPDIFSGPVYTPDELGAVIDPETGDVLSLPAEDAPPKGKKLDAFVQARAAAPAPKAPSREEQDRAYEQEQKAPPRPEPEPEAVPDPQLSIVPTPEPPATVMSETALALKRSIVMKQRDKLGLSQSEFNILCLKVASKPFAAMTTELDLNRIQNLLAGMIAGRTRASRRTPDGAA